jgi:PIN domain nuclease of toxin-antitoxin system
VRLLLDTHVLLWWDSEPSKIPPSTLQILENPQNNLWISIVSLWEIQIKTQLGKLKLNLPLQDLVAQQQQINGLQLLPIDLRHVLALEALPYHHKDPFDRLLIAQSVAENLVCVSADSVFKQYAISLLW